MSGKPFSKETQLSRGARRYVRKVATPKVWAAIVAEKTGPCRCCLSTGPVEFHHVVPRSIGGSDVAENLVPLCSDDHQKVTNGDKDACVTLRLSLTDDEFGYAVRKIGVGRLDARYPVEKP